MAKPGWDPEQTKLLAMWLVRHFLRQFPKWDWWDICSEIFILIHDRYDRWDPEKGSLPTYCLTHFRDPLSIRYHADTGVRIKRGNNVKREYLPNVPYIDERGDVHIDHDPIEFPWFKLTPQETGLVQKRLQGYTLKQIGISENVTESRQCQNLRKIRTKLDGTFYPDPDG